MRLPCCEEKKVSLFWKVVYPSRRDHQLFLIFDEEREREIEKHQWQQLKQEGAQLKGGLKN